MKNLILVLIVSLPLYCAGQFSNQEEPIELEIYYKNITAMIRYSLDEFQIKQEKRLRFHNRKASKIFRKLEELDYNDKVMPEKMLYDYRILGIFKFSDGSSTRYGISSNGMILIGENYYESNPQALKVFKKFISDKEMKRSIKIYLNKRI